MHQVRHDVDLFRHDPNRKVTDQEPIERMTERKRAVRAVTVQPNDVDRAERDHGVEKADCEKLPGEVVRKENDREW